MNGKKGAQVAHCCCCYAAGPGRSVQVSSIVLLMSAIQFCSNNCDKSGQWPRWTPAGRGGNSWSWTWQQCPWQQCASETVSAAAPAVQTTRTRVVRAAGSGWAGCVLNRALRPDERNFLWFFWLFWGRCWSRARKKCYKHFSRARGHVRFGKVVTKVGHVNHFYSARVHCERKFSATRIP